MDGFGAGLDNKEFAGFAVFGPLHVHRRPFFSFFGVMVFDHDGPLGEFFNFFVVNNERMFFFGSAGDDFGSFDAGGVFGVNHFFVFDLKFAANDWKRRVFLPD